MAVIYYEHFCKEGIWAALNGGSVIPTVYVYGLDEQEEPQMRAASLLPVLHYTVSTYAVRVAGINLRRSSGVRVLLECGMLAEAWITDRQIDDPQPEDLTETLLISTHDIVARQVHAQAWLLERGSDRRIRGLSLLGRSLANDDDGENELLSILEAGFRETS